MRKKNNAELLLSKALYRHITTQWIQYTYTNSIRQTTTQWIQKHIVRFEFIFTIWSVDLRTIWASCKYFSFAANSLSRRFFIQLVSIISDMSMAPSWKCLQNKHHCYDKSSPCRNVERVSVHFLILVYSKHIHWDIGSLLLCSFVHNLLNYWVVVIIVIDIDGTILLLVCCNGIHWNKTIELQEISNS